MKHILLFLVFNIIFFAVNAQEIQETLDKKTQKKMQKEERNRLKDEELLEKKEYILSLINSKKFVLEANNISGKSGAMIPVPPNLNFFAVDSSKAVIQIGSTSGIGYTGVGGITDDGSVSRYEIKENKSNISIRIFLAGKLTSYTIFVSASYGTTSTARVTGLSGGVITFHGKIVPISESRVFKGFTIY